MTDKHIQAIVSYAKDFKQYGSDLNDIADQYRTQYDLGNDIAGVGSSMDVRRHERQLNRLKKDLVLMYTQISRILSYIENYDYTNRSDYEDDLVAVLVHHWNETNPSDTTVEVTQSDGEWSFYHKGKLSENYRSLKEAVKFIKDNEY